MTGEKEGSERQWRGQEIRETRKRENVEQVCKMFNTCAKKGLTLQFDQEF